MFWNNLFEIGVGFAPVFGVLFSRIPHLNGKNVALLTQGTIVGAILLVAMTYRNIPGGTRIEMVLIYPVFLLVFTIIFRGKYGYQHFAKILGLSLMLMYVITELQEYPVFFDFIFDFEHSPNFVLGQMAHAYTVLVAYLAVKLAHIKRTKTNLVATLTLLLIIPLFYVVDPLVDIHGLPSLLAYAKRIATFIILSFIFVRGKFDEG